MKFISFFVLLGTAIFVSGCTGSSLHSQNQSTTVVEVTSFKTQAGGVDPAAFAARDAEIESDYTAQQPGYIQRLSGVNAEGEYVVVVYWESMAHAEASMKKFMTDASVADYAGMIDGPSMKMARYEMSGTSPDSLKSQTGLSGGAIIEVTSFRTKAEGVDAASFMQRDAEIERDYTSKQPGYIKRLSGVNEAGETVVVVYWKTQADADASMKKFMSDASVADYAGMIDGPSMKMARYKMLESAPATSNKDKAVALLNTFNTGDKGPIAYINPETYIQHNLAVGDGLAGFAEVMQHAPPGGFKAKVVRAFEDGDFVFTHTIYDFFGPKIGFDVFRFEDGLIVEHWDNLIEVQPPNPSGRTQTDGTREVADLDKTAANKAVIKGFVDDILLGHQYDKLASYINPEKYLQHNPAVADGLDGFGAAMKFFAKNGLVMEYSRNHMLLGEGNFVLAVSEGKFGKGDHTAYYDLFRLEDGKIVEHWDVISTIPPKSEWKNDNGKF